VSFSLRHSQPRHPVSKPPQNWHSLPMSHGANGVEQA
jgi:hypothetical protein